MIRIGEFSSLAKTTVKTLRFYDEIDLFKPEFVDTNGYRYYSVNQLNELQKIVEMRSLNIPIDEIKTILNGGNKLETFKKRLSELENEMIVLVNNINLIKNYLAKAERGEKMKKYEAKIINLNERVVFYRHGIIPTMKDLVPFILEAGDEVRENNPTLKCAKPDYCFVTYGANEYKETDVEVEYAQAVEKFGVESENIKFKNLPSFKAISVTHIGSYSTLAEAYAFALNFAKEKGYEIVAPIRECYIEGCWSKENEEDYVTEIQIPVK